MSGPGRFGRLVLAELERLRSRRVSLVAGLVLLVAVGLYQIAVDDEVRPPTASEVSEQQRYFDQAHQEWEQQHAAQEDACVASGGTRADCAWPEPTPADYSLTASAFVDVAPSAVQLSAYLTLLATFVVGASFMGAEYSTGSLANWLTFVPRRLHVYGSKVVAVVLASAAAGAVVNFLMLGLVALLTRLHGGGLAGLGASAATAGRAVPLACLAAVAGFVFALLTRYTVAALGIALGYVVVSGVLGGFASRADGPLGWLPPWLAENNVAAFLGHGTTYVQYVQTVTEQGTSGSSVEKHLSFAHSAVYWLVLLVVSVVAAAAVFRRRDVT